MNRVKNFDATGTAPNGRLYPGDLNAIQDAAAGLADLVQNMQAASYAIGEIGLTLARFGAGEAVINGMFRVNGIFRALAGLVHGSFTTAQRDALATGKAPTALVIWNSSLSALQINVGTDAARNWQTVALGALGPWNTNDIVDAAITTPKIANGAITAPKLAAGVIPRMLWGTISTAGAITSGSGGFTVVRNGNGDYSVTFTTPFSTVPAVTANAQWLNNANDAAAVSFQGMPTVNGFRTWIALGQSGSGGGAVPADEPWNFIAIGT